MELNTRGQHTLNLSRKNRYELFCGSATLEQLTEAGRQSFQCVTTRESLGVARYFFVGLVIRDVL